MKIVVVEVPDGRFRFKVLAGDGEVVAASGTFRHKVAALHGAAEFKSELAAAAVEDHTGDHAGPGATTPTLTRPLPGSLPPI